MGRPKLPMGAYGSINVRMTSKDKKTGEEKWRARARHRDQDGRLRSVVRYGKSENAATLALKAAMVQRTAPPSSGDVSRDTTLEAFARRWLDIIQSDTSKGPTTRERYRWVVERVICPDAGGWRLHECTYTRLEALLRTVERERGTATAKTTKAVLTMLLAEAVKHGALTANPARELPAIGSVGKTPKALTVDEVRTLLRKLDADRLAGEHDLPDLVRFMLMTGVRIGEACALRAREVNLDAGTVTILATMTDTGRAERTKTRAGHRVLALPEEAVALLRRRLDDPRIATHVAVFPSPLGHLRDSSNTAAHLRRAFDRAGFAWVTSHSLRKTAATRLDEAGLTAREAADHLGHSDVTTTLNVYYGRRIATTKAADALTPKW